MSGIDTPASTPSQILFLPGASGDVDFWKPVAAQLRLPPGAARHVGWPGFGPTPADPGVVSVQDLADDVVTRIDGPTALVAQSMGGVVALLAALARPAQVTHLVLAALSGGVDLARHGARDWRPPREERRPGDPAHLFAACDMDLSSHLPALRMPVLLLWGDSDPVSPAGVGRWLETVLPASSLHVIPGGTHVFARTRASEVAPLIERHLASRPA